MTAVRTFATLLVATWAFTAASAADVFDHESHLPPAPEWDGRSVELMVDADHPWATDFEKSGGFDSPDYEATMAWARRLVDASEDLAMVSLGESPEGRSIEAIIASTEGAFTLDALRASDRPLLFAHAGIHSGEIDGKDAGFMLLRDMTVVGTKRALIENANFVFVPIFSVDAHERRSEYSRMNQRGPTVQGWRTTAQNLNLNRDYTKAQAPEMQHMLRALTACDPDLYLDLHVTDGADYQYDITYGANGTHGWSPAINAWLGSHYRSTVDAALTEWGHVPGPLIFTVDRADITKGMFAWTAGPRYSNGYGDARHLPTVLLENHSLKPYRQRVLGTYVYLEASLRALIDDVVGLRAAIAADRTARPETVHLAYERSPEPVDTIDFLAIRESTFESTISGGTEVTYGAETFTVNIPVLGNAVRASEVERPAAYWIPSAWSHLAWFLDIHGVEYETIDAPVSREVEMIRLPDAAMEERPFEGRPRVAPGDDLEIETVSVDYRAGSLRVPTDQDLGTLAVLLLEPQSPDGLFQWGFLLAILSRTEYFESYAMEPMARAMAEENPERMQEFEAALAAGEIDDTPRARLDWWYEKTPFYDREWKLYPIAREVD